MGNSHTAVGIQVISAVGRKLFLLVSSVIYYYITIIISIMCFCSAINIIASSRGQ